MSPFASALHTATIALDARYPKQQVIVSLERHFFSSINSGALLRCVSLRLCVSLDTQAVGKIPIYALETCSHSAMACAQTVVAERRLVFEDVSFELLGDADGGGPGSATATKARAGRFLRLLETRPVTHVAVVAHADFIRETLACAIGPGADHAVQNFKTTQGHSEIWLVKDPRTDRNHWRIPDGQFIAVIPNQRAQP